MSARKRFISIGGLLFFISLIYLAIIAQGGLDWKENTPIRDLEAYTARLVADRTHLPSDIAKARQLSTESSMTYEELTQTSRYAAYGVMAIGVLFSLIGIAIPNQSRGSA